MGLRVLAFRVRGLGVQAVGVAGKGIRLYKLRLEAQGRVSGSGSWV